MYRPRRILMPTDFSEHADHALSIGADIAQQMRSRIHLVHVLPPPIVGVPIAPGVAMPPMPDTSELLRIQREEAARALAAAGAKLAEGRPDIEAIDEELLEGPTHEAICEAAERVGADLIVMGTRGRTGLSHLLLGSVAERTIRHAPCPVMTVNRRDA